MAAHQVRALLMGGQACVFYGAAEFSRDTDLLLLSDADNLSASASPSAIYRPGASPSRPSPRSIWSAVTPSISAANTRKPPA